MSYKSVTPMTTSRRMIRVGATSTCSNSSPTRKAGLAVSVPSPGYFARRTICCTFFRNITKSTTLRTKWILSSAEKLQYKRWSSWRRNCSQAFPTRTCSSQTTASHGCRSTRTIWGCWYTWFPSMMWNKLTSTGFCPEAKRSFWRNLWSTSSSYFPIADRTRCFVTWRQRDWRKK